MAKNDLKIKNLTISEMLLAADRLTRFKFPETKYNRVFREIIAKYLIEPKISFKEYDKLSSKEIANYIEAIFDSSIKNLSTPALEDFELLETVQQLDKSIFCIDKKTEQLMQTKIPYKSLLTLSAAEELCPNLALLNKVLTENISPTEAREKYNTKFPIEKVVLAEGITEEILLPSFGKILNYDFNQKGIEIVAAGGKNQVAKDYIQLINQLKCPIIVLLDADAKTIADQIRDKLRPIDKLLLIEKGEFEDILPIELITSAINYRFLNFYSITASEFPQEGSRVKELEELYRINKLGEFKKAEFASNVKTVLEQTDNIIISDEIHHIIDEIKTL